MENLVHRVVETWAHWSALIEAFYKDHTGLVNLIGLLVAAASAWFAYCAIRTPRQNIHPRLPALLNSSQRIELLEKIQRERVDPYLSQGLRQVTRIDLRLAETPDAVQPKLRIYASRESGIDVEGPIQGPIQSVFRQMASGRLLILGEPGTGKTNILMELAQSLIADAKVDESSPIPIVFSLPRWTLGKGSRTLVQWLEDDIHVEYGCSLAVAETLVQQEGILPLLDGLDEVAEGRRASCVDAIHTYLRERNLGRVVVCCRMEEYEKLPKLELGAAVRLEKLTRQDVEREISKPHLGCVREALRADPQLWEVVDTPLWLHVLYCAARVKPPSGSRNLRPTDRLYARYVEYALGRNPEGSPRRRTTREPLLRYLVWLAAEMRRRNQTQFALEEMDFSLLASERTRWAALWSELLTIALIFGPIGALGAGLVGGLMFGLIGGLVGGLSLVLIGGLVVRLSRGLLVWRKNPEVAEELCFSWRSGIFGFRYGLRYGLIAGLIAGLGGGLMLGLVVGLDDGLITGLSAGLSLGLSVGLSLVLLAGLMFGLEAALETRSMSVRLAPNRGTQRSLHHAMTIAGGAVALVLSVGLLMVDGFHLLAPRFLGITQAALACLLLWGLALGFKKGGFFALQHYTIRLFLWRQGVVPLRYVRFLNEAVERLFLIRRGGSYEFFHLTFRDFMARAFDAKGSVVEIQEARAGGLKT